MLDQERAGDFEEQVADEEQPDADPEHGVGEAEVGLHPQLGEPDVGAVEVRDDVQEEEQREDAPRDLPPGGPGDVGEFVGRRVEVRHQRGGPGGVAAYHECRPQARGKAGTRARQ